MFTHRSRGARLQKRRSVYIPSAEALESRTLLSLQPPVHYPAGTNPNIPNVGDFNRDGALDIAVDNAEGHNISVFLNNGDGTFGSAVNYATGQRPYSLTVADMNGDQLLDLVTGDFGSGTVSVLLGNGDGTFRPRISSTAGLSVEDVKAGDFNGDGRLDLAAPQNRNPGAVLVLLGNGDGTLGAPTSYATGVGSAFMAIADVNGDTRLDLLVPNITSNNVSVLLGNGDGTFQAAQNFPAGPACIMVAAGDFNGDTRPDLAVGNSANPNGSVSVLLGNGDGTFGTPTSYPVGAVAESVAVGDMNNDGKLDLIVASDGAGVTVYLGNGDGTFGSRMDFAVQNTPAATVGDLNNDGFLDVVDANFNSNTISVLINDGYWGGPVVYFYIYPDSGTVTAGQPFDVYVIPLSASFEVVSNYTGQILFYATDPQATTPVYYQFQLSDHGIAYFPGGLTFNTLGLQELYVFDYPAIQVFGYAAYNVVGAGPSSGGGGGQARPALDLFAGQELGHAAEVAVSRTAALTPATETLQQAGGSAVLTHEGAPAVPAEVGPAARLGGAPATRPILDHLFATLDDHVLAD